MRWLSLLLALACWLGLDRHALAVDRTEIDETYTKPGSATSWGNLYKRYLGSSEFGLSYALVIGIDDYDDNSRWADLNWSVADTRRVRDYLINDEGFDQVVMLTNGKASKARIQELMYDVFPNLTERDRFVFWFSGHGISATLGSGRTLGYLPLKASRANGWSSMLDMDDVERWSDRLAHVRQTLFVIDSCFSGLAGTEVRSTPVEEQIKALAKPAHYLLTAGTEHEESQAGDRWRGGLFTTSLLDALRGAADSSDQKRPADGVVSLFEAMTYAQAEIAEAMSRGWIKQGMTPQVRRLQKSDGAFFSIARPMKYKVDGVQSGTPLKYGEPERKGGGTVRVPAILTPEQQAALVPPREVQPPEAPAAPALSPGKVFRDCPVCPEMVVVPSGSFMMGSPASEAGRFGDEGPQHRVTIGKPFAVGRYEVTFAEWDACVSEGGCSHKPEDGWGRDRQPVIKVSWNDVQHQYLPWLSGKTGQRYRLLSEAEWEYAARAGTTTAYHWGDRFDESKANNGSKTAEVGRYPANAFGLYDMHGNVWEWVEDLYHDSYTGAPTNGSARLSGPDSLRVLRGGSWFNNPRVLRAAVRNWLAPVVPFNYAGFRVARMLTS